MTSDAYRPLRQEEGIRRSPADTVPSNAEPGIMPPEIAERIGIKSRVVSATVSRMKSRGDLEAHRGGVRMPAPGPVAT